MNSDRIFPSEFEMAFHKSDYSFVFFSSNVDPIYAFSTRATILHNAKKVVLEHKQQGWLMFRIIFEEFSIRLEISKPNAWVFMDIEALKSSGISEVFLNRISNCWLVTLEAPWSYRDGLVDGSPYSLQILKQIVGIKEFFIVNNRSDISEAIHFGWLAELERCEHKNKIVTRTDEEWGRIYEWREKLGLSVQALPSHFPLSLFENISLAWPMAMEQMQDEIDNRDPLLNALEQRVKSIFTGNADPFSSSEWERLVEKSGLVLP